MRILHHGSGLWPTEYKDVARIFVTPDASSPRLVTCHPDHGKSAVVLGAVKDLADGAKHAILDRSCARRFHANVWVGTRKRALSRSNKETRDAT